MTRTDSADLHVLEQILSRIDSKFRLIEDSIVSVRRPADKLFDCFQTDRENGSAAVAKHSREIQELKIAFKRALLAADEESSFSHGPLAKEW